MGYHELDELGEKIQDIIDSAINEKNYQKLNQTINLLRLQTEPYLGFSEEPDGHRPERTFRSMELHTEKFRQQPEAGTSCPIHAN